MRKTKFYILFSIFKKFIKNSNNIPSISKTIQHTPTDRQKEGISISPIPDLRRVRRYKFHFLVDPRGLSHPGKAKFQDRNTASQIRYRYIQQGKNFIYGPQCEKLIFFCLFVGPWCLASQQSSDHNNLHVKYESNPIRTSWVITRTMKCLWTCQ